MSLFFFFVHRQWAKMVSNSENGRQTLAASTISSASSSLPAAAAATHSLHKLDLRSFCNSVARVVRFFFLKKSPWPSLSIAYSRLTIMLISLVLCVSVPLFVYLAVADDLFCKFRSPLRHDHDNFVRCIIKIDASILIIHLLIDHNLQSSKEFCKMILFCIIQIMQ